MIDAIKLLPPDTVRHGDATARIGATVYRAIRELLAAGGSVSVADLCLAVWGRAVAGQCAIWSLVHRANQALRSIGFPGRIACDYGEVVIV